MEGGLVGAFFGCVVAWRKSGAWGEIGQESK